jgi:hypothetical protein
MEKRNLLKYVKSSFYPLRYILASSMININSSTHVKRGKKISRRTYLIMTSFGLTLLSLSISFLIASPLQATFAQLSSPSSGTAATEDGVNSQLAELETARQQYLSVWNNTAFNSRFDVFIAEGSHLGYGLYREHVPANVFRPGETIVLYMEPVGFAHEPIIDTSTVDVNNSEASDSRTLYLINMTADYIISDSSGTVLATIEDLPAASLFSHAQNTEFSLTLTLSQEEPFPAGDYIITYVVHDDVTGQSFQIDRGITIDDNAVTGALPLPGINDDRDLQDIQPQQQLEERAQALQ